MGVILYVLLAGFLPFNEKTVFALFAKINTADYTFPEWFLPKAVSLIESIMVIDPSKRITMSEIRNHPWLAKTEKVSATVSETSAVSVFTAAEATASSDVPDASDLQSKM